MTYFQRETENHNRILTSLITKFQHFVKRVMENHLIIGKYEMPQIFIL